MFVRVTCRSLRLGSREPRLSFQNTTVVYFGQRIAGARVPTHGQEAAIVYWLRPRTSKFMSIMNQPTPLRRFGHFHDPYTCTKSQSTVDPDSVSDDALVASLIGPRTLSDSSQHELPQTLQKSNSMVLAFVFFAASCRGGDRLRTRRTFTVVASSFPSTSSLHSTCRIARTSRPSGSDIHHHFCTSALQ